MNAITVRRWAWVACLVAALGALAVMSARQRAPVPTAPDGRDSAGLSIDLRSGPNGGPLIVLARGGRTVETTDLNPVLVADNAEHLLEASAHEPLHLSVSQVPAAEWAPVGWLCAGLRQRAKGKMTVTLHVVRGEVFDPVAVTWTSQSTPRRTLTILSLGTIQSRDSAGLVTYPLHVRSGEREFRTPRSNLGPGSLDQLVKLLASILQREELAVSTRPVGFKVRSSMSRPYEYGEMFSLISALQEIGRLQGMVVLSK